MRKDGDRLIIEPAKPRSLLATLEPIEEDFADIAGLPIDPVEF